MNNDDPAKALSRSLTRLTWTINLWGTAITLILGITRITLYLSGTTNQP